MNKYILVCFFLAMAIPAAFATACDTTGDTEGNALRTQLSITEAANSATISASGLNFCASLGGSDSCCTQATVNGFQTTIDTMITDIQTAETARDQAFVTLRTDETNGIPSTFADLLEVNVKATAAIAKIDTLTPAATYTALRAAAVLAQNFLAGAVSSIVTTRAAFAGYLENRATCVRKLVETQASVMCLACRVGIDTTYGVTESSGVVTVPYPDAYKTALKAACFDYFDQAQDQSATYNYFLTDAAITSLKTDLDAITTNGASSGVDASDITASLGTIRTQATAANSAINLESSCATQAGCSYIYDTVMMMGAQLDTDKLAAGGTATRRRILAEENSRMLQSTYDPAANPSGVSLTAVVANPGNVDTSSAWRQGGALTCVVALVAMLLF